MLRVASLPKQMLIPKAAPAGRAARESRHHFHGIDLLALDRGGGPLAGYIRPLLLGLAKGLTEAWQAQDVQHFNFPNHKC